MSFSLTAIKYINWTKNILKVSNIAIFVDIGITARITRSAIVVSGKRRHHNDDCAHPAKRSTAGAERSRGARNTQTGVIRLIPTVAKQRFFRIARKARFVLDPSGQISANQGRAANQIAQILIVL